MPGTRGLTHCPSDVRDETDPRRMRWIPGDQDGEILVRSVEGHGTIFTVKLPLQAKDVESSLESVR